MPEWREESPHEEHEGCTGKSLDFHWGHDLKSQERRLSKLEPFRTKNLVTSDNVLSAVALILEDHTLSEAGFLLSVVHEIIHGFGRRAQAMSIGTVAAGFERELRKSENSTARERLELGAKEEDDGKGDKRENEEEFGTLSAPCEEGNTSQVDDD